MCIRDRLPEARILADTRPWYGIEPVPFPLEGIGRQVDMDTTAGQ